MRDAFIGGEEGGIEDAAGGGAGEVTGFADRVEDLAEGGRVDGEVVDRFVRGDWDAGNVAGFGEHGEDGAGVGGSKGFPLD